MKIIIIALLIFVIGLPYKLIGQDQTYDFENAEWVFVEMDESDEKPYTEYYNKTTLKILNKSIIVDVLNEYDNVYIKNGKYRNQAITHYILNPNNNQIAIIKISYYLDGEYNGKIDFEIGDFIEWNFEEQSGFNTLLKKIYKDFNIEK